MKEKIEIVYTGKALERGRVLQCFRKLEAGALGSEVVFKSARSISGYMVGHIYTIKSDGNMFSFSTTEWVREYEDTAKVMEWQAAHKATETKRAKLALEKREATNDSALIRAIESMKPAYKALRHSDRPAFELWLLTKLRK